MKRMLKITLVGLVCFSGSAMIIAQDFPGPVSPPNLPSNVTAKVPGPATQDPSVARVPGVQQAGSPAPHQNPLNALPNRVGGPNRNAPMPGGQNPFGPGPGVGGPAVNIPIAADRKFQNKINQLVRQIAAAKDSSAEKSLSRELRKQLEELFDERMKRREKEIEALRNRLKKLEEKNDARLQMKDEIVELKLKSLVNEAKGFGF